MVRVRSQQQNVATVTTGAQQEELTEKEVMSRKYNEQMQKQMGWNNPYEVGLGRNCRLVHNHQYANGVINSAMPSQPCIQSRFSQYGC